MGGRLFKVLSTWESESVINMGGRLLKVSSIRGVTRVGCEIEVVAMAFMAFLCCVVNKVPARQVPVPKCRAGARRR